VSYDERNSLVRWNDWRWAGAGVNPPGVPSPAVLTEIATDWWSWLFTNNNVLAFHDLQIPHDYAEGTDIIPHIHWCPTTTATYTGTWTLTINSWLLAANGEPRETPLVVTQAFNAAMTQYQMQSADFSANLLGAGRKISSMATATLSLSLSAGAGCALLGLDGHYQVDGHGSREVLAK